MLIRTVYLSPAALTPAVRDEVWTFFSQYVRRSREAFERALDGTQQVGLTRDAEGTLRAFLALTVHEAHVEGRRVSVIHTPWAVVDPSCRRKNLVQKAGARAWLRELLRHPGRRMYWMFGASTYVSYLILARNFATFWPRRGDRMPPFERAVSAEIMRQNGEENYDPRTGVVRRFGVSRYQEGVAADDPAALADPDVAFYAESNPGQTEGDTLVCLCPLTWRNWVALIRNLLRRKRNR